MTGGDSNKYKRCFVVGEGPIAVRCGEILLKHGYLIMGVITREESVQRWARNHHLPQRKFDLGLADFLREEPFDYLFSIFNVHILKSEILALPRRGAINYHDALLPRYAGLHAPSWAILNRETRHGITWHRMVDQVDGGEILAQRSFGISPEDSALSLNQRCFDAAVETFAELVEGLAENGVAGVTQDLTQRTYFPREQRPEAACILDWNQSAEELLALVKALDFGPFRNPLGLPKIAFTEGILGVREATIASSSVWVSPGTVVAIERERLVIGTSSLPLRLGGFSTLEGRPLSCREVQEMHRLSVGERLPELGRAEREMISEINARVCIHEAFWAGRLRSLNPLTMGEGLPSDSGPSPKEVRLQWTIPSEVDRWLSEQGMTTRDRQLFLLTAFGGYLARVQREECFDVPLSLGDRRLALCRGLFSEHVPFRFMVDLSKDFSSLLQVIREELTLLRKHVTYSRDLVAREPDLCGKLPVLGLSPKLAMFLPERLTGHERLGAEGMAILFPEHGDEGLLLFDRCHVDEGSLRREIRQFTTFLSGVATNPTQPLARVPLLSEEERRGLLPLPESSSRSSRQEGEQSSVQELFEAQVRRSPHAVAVVWAGSRLTYAELNQQANELAKRLRDAGIGPEEIVGIYLKRSLQAIISLWGVMKSGGAFLTLDPSAPKFHTASILGDARPRVILATPDLAKDLEAMGFSSAWMDVNPSLPSEEPLENPFPVSSGRGLAYVMYTSGSTGQPKGVMVEHGALLNFCLAVRKRFALSPRDRVLQFSSLSFDACLEEIIPCLLAGGTLVLRTEEMIQSPARFLEACEAHAVTLLDLPTAYWSHLTSGMERESLSLPSSVRMVVIGGEAATATTLRTWREVLKIDVPLLNTYGPTEATVTAIWCDLAEDGILRSYDSAVPIGKPLPGVAAYVLDAVLEPVPLGAVGELCLSGGGIARGYLHRGDLTAEKFVLASWQRGDGTRLYRTGDKVRCRSDGNLEFLGRLDHQVKIRGFRVELGGVEASLLELPEVKSCCVVAKSNSRGEQSLHAFVTVRDDESISPGACRERLRHKIPDYMMQEEIIFLEELPQTKAGKVDRRALQARSGDEGRSGRLCQPPADDLEAALVGIWQDILQRVDVGTRDNFFDLGGHSLLAVVLTDRMSQCFRQEIPLSWVFQSPTIEQLARESRAVQIRPTGFITVRKEDHGRLDQLGNGAPESESRNDWIGFLTQRHTTPWWRRLVTRERSERVVPLRADGGESPLFVLPGGWAGENELMIFAAMLPDLPPDLPLYGLKQDFSLRPERLASSVAEIARNFWVEIRKVQPKGPYNLMAECIASVIALEMARQVEKIGETLNRIILLDPQLLDTSRLQDGNASGELPENVKRYYRILSEGKPASYSGTLFILATEDEIPLRKRLSQWKAFQAENLVIRRLPGDHFSYIRSHRREVAREIGNILRPKTAITDLPSRSELFFERLKPY